MPDHTPDASPRSPRDDAPPAFHVPRDPARGPAYDREVSRVAATESVRRGVAEVRAAEARRWAALFAYDVAADAAPPPELVPLLAQLRASVAAYVCRLRDDGVPPERAIAGVKAVVQEARSPDGRLAGPDQLMAQVVRWSIEAYYDEPALRGSPRFF